MANAGKKQLKIVVDLGRSAHRRAGIARIDLLLDGNGGCDAGNQIDIGFVDTSQELTRIGRQALNVATLSLGEDSVEGQSRFTRAGKARDYGESIMGDGNVHILKVMDARSLDIDSFVL